MGQGKSIGILIAVLALALTAAWFFSRDDGVRSNAAELSDSSNALHDCAPLELPDASSPEGVSPDPVVADPSADLESGTDPETAPLLDTPDYGPAIQRGGAFVDFELYDSAGTRVPVQQYSATLRRKVGDFWIADECTTNSTSNVVECHGLGEYGSRCGGLEPGEYELELLSSRWGNFRHEFSVAKGETRTDRLTTPHTKVAVCFRFADADGNPIAYLPNRPRVQTSADPLEPREYHAPQTVSLRSSPLEPLGGVGGSGWRSVRSGDGRPYRPDVPPLYPTDDGAWWVQVYAGGHNTVTFALDELWGQAEYVITDTFTARQEVPVTLGVPAGFAEAALEWGKPVEGYTPGDRNILEIKPEPAPRAQFDPYRAEVKQGQTRLLVECGATVPVRVQLSRNGKDYWNVLYQRGDAHWYDLNSNGQYWMRLTDNRLMATPWEPLDVSGGGLLTIRRDVNMAPVSFGADGLSPTLRAFAYTIDFGIAVLDPPEPEPDPAEDPRIEEDAVDEVEPDPSDVPNHDLAENPNDDSSEGGARPTPRPIDLRASSPSATRFTLVIRQEDGKQQLETIPDNERIHDADISAGVQVRTYLRGASRFRKGRNGMSSLLPNRRHWFEPLVLAGRWESVDCDGESLYSLLASGRLQPHFDNVFAARAVGPKQEGLPWVKGVIVEYEKDKVAQQVRAICEQHRNELKVQPNDAAAYAASLEATETETSADGLRALIGDDNYEAFETDDQRLWFARQGAWYDTTRKVYSDDQGYFAIQDPALEPGKYYVLYLWSNSRDDLHPDARFAFKVDDRGVADLGAIHLPTYSE